MLPALLEVAGIVCLSVAGALIDPALAWLVAGLGLIGKGFEVEERGRAAIEADRPNMNRERG